MENSMLFAVYWQLKHISNCVYYWVILSFVPPLLRFLPFFIMLISYGFCSFVWTVTVISLALNTYLISWKRNMQLTIMVTLKLIIFFNYLKRTLQDFYYLLLINSSLCCLDQWDCSCGILHFLLLEKSNMLFMYKIYVCKLCNYSLVMLFFFHSLYLVNGTPLLLDLARDCSIIDISSSLEATFHEYEFMSMVNCLEGRTIWTVNVIWKHRIKKPKITAQVGDTLVAGHF